MTGTIISRQPNLFLGLLLGLLTINVALLVWQGEYAYDDFSGIVVVLMLILNHVSFYLVKSGRWAKPVRTAALVWSSAGLLYIFSILLR
jgi:hypothetical protein